jgi:ribosomal protein S8
MFRSSTCKCNWDNSLVSILKKKGYLLNFTEIERQAEIPLQTINQCITSGKCNSLCSNLAKIESFIYDFFNIGIDYSKNKPNFVETSKELLL